MSQFPLRLFCCAVYIRKQQHDQHELLTLAKHGFNDTVRRIYPANKPLLRTIVNQQQEENATESEESRSNVRDAVKSTSQEQLDRFDGFDTNRSDCFAMMTSRKDLASLHELMQKEKQMRISLRRRAGANTAVPTLELSGQAMVNSHESSSCAWSATPTTDGDLCSVVTATTSTGCTGLLDILSETAS